MSSILRSSDLIKSVKRRAFIPNDQNTFSEDDFLEIATEKININLMDQLMVARGDYLVYFVDFPLVDGTSEYPLPSRAHGNKLREASIVDENGKTVRELTQISLEEVSDYDTDYSTYSHFDPFYLRNDSLVLIRDNFNPGQAVRMYFYMRPNKLVLESRAATAGQIVTSFEVDTISPKIGTITNISTEGAFTSVNHGLKSGDTIVITGTNSTPSADGTQTVVYIDSNTFNLSGVTITTAGNSGSWSLATQVVSIPSTIFPKHFTSNLTYDVVSPTSPNKIKLYDIQPNSVNNSLKTISFRTGDVGDKIKKGDYITKSEETIVPNIPTEYHPMLAQMVACHCLEGMGDEQAVTRATKTLKEMEQAILRIVTNRVEGAPKKIKNRNGTLNQAITRNKFRSRS